MTTPDLSVVIRSYQGRDEDVGYLPVEDLQAGRALHDEVAPGERTDARTSLRWSELERLHASGRVEIESHTWLHRRVGVAADGRVSLFEVLRRKLVRRRSGERGW